jgi:Protein of unknown function (DUF2442)
MKWITHVSQVKDFRLKVTFNDGKEAVINFEPLLIGEVFEPLRDVEFFGKFLLHPELDVITWPNGADFSPDYLYEVAKSQSKVSA